eukprot:2300148-Pyramimonas_sp.AAC.1
MSRLDTRGSPPCVEGSSWFWDRGLIGRSWFPRTTTSGRLGGLAHPVWKPLGRLGQGLHGRSLSSNLVLARVGPSRVGLRHPS